MAQRIPARVAWLLRARRSFLALSLALSLWLGVRLFAPIPGFPGPLALAVLGPLAAFIGFIWPLSVRWVRVGRRLGLGGKLAGLVAAVKTGETAFASPLASQISFSSWRLFFPEVLVLLPVLALTGFLLIPVRPSKPDQEILPPEASPAVEGVVEIAPSPQPQKAERQGSWARVLPHFPQDFPQALAPYADLLAELLGEEVLPEEVWERLSREEGLLRALATLLAEASAQGWTREMREEFAQLVPELSGLGLGLPPSPTPQETGAAAEAQGALALAPGSSSPEGEATSSADQKAVPSQGEGEAQALAPAGEVIGMDTEEEGNWRAKLEDAEDGLGLGAGWEKGEPGPLGPPLVPPKLEEVVPVPVKPGAGPVRQGFALGLPGEIPKEEPAGAASVSPGEAELLLGAKELPADLRELVRRYFQLLAEGGDR